MTLNRDALGKTIGPIKKDYVWRDVAIYALGVGAGYDDIEYCWEKNLKVLPTFSIASVFEFFGHVGINSGMNLAGILHGEQELIFHRPIPVEGSLITEGRISGYYDKGEGKGALVVAESDTRGSDGDLLFTSILTVFSRFDGGFGGENISRKERVLPDRKPDFVVMDTPSKNQPLLYRLSGDLFDIHVDKAFAAMAGFERPIMHGLCTLGFACRALVNKLVPGEPSKVRRLACRFSKPLYPGTPIRTLIWKIDEKTALWTTENMETGELAISQGLFEYGDAPV
ncbi:MAG: MaoC family dehydratase N-terminal domain-containing protein [Proteobacteria bacterium]|nr:MaoC family dehydratase N-terminal domain-containing protein [Pseudomonadota bacterium]